MKNNTRSRGFIRIICISALVALAPLTGRSAIVLTVDVTDWSAVVFTATANGADASASGASFFTGLNLENFFSGLVTAPVDLGAESGDTLSIDVGVAETPTSSVRLTAGDDYTFTDQNLNLYWQTGGNISVVSGNAPFSGSATIDMSAIDSNLIPLAGATGNIRLGDASPIGAVFGQYEVTAVPEVETVLQSLLFVGLFLAFKGRNLLSKSPKLLFWRKG